MLKNQKPRMNVLIVKMYGGGYEQKFTAIRI